MESTVDLPGQLQPYLSVDIYTKENSFVKSMNVDIGSNVHKGQLLLNLEAPEMQTQLTQAIADADTKLATYKGSLANYNRLLHASKSPGAISPNDLDLALSKKSADSATWMAAVANYKQARQLLAYLTIAAPFDGVITARNVSPGAYVTPGDKTGGKPMLTLEQRDRLRLTMNVAEDYIRYLAVGDSVRFTVNAYPDKQFTVRISRMAGGLNLQTRTEQVEMDVENTDHRLLPQMYADIHLSINDQQSCFIIPRTALVVGTDAKYVIRNKNGKAERVNVVSLFDNAKNTAIKGDLSEGDQIVKSATDELRNGTPLKGN